MYAKCGALSTAHQVFDELSTRNVVAWNALIAGYAQHGHGQKALSCYEWMQHEGLSPNERTFSCAIKACGSMRAAYKAKGIHDDLVKQGFSDNDVLLGTALLDMYIKCEAFELAITVFTGLSSRDTVAWTALITGYVESGYSEKAVTSFEEMQLEGLLPNAFTFACILKACGSIGAAERDIHSMIMKEGLLGGDILLGNSLVDMYAKCGIIDQAKAIFDELPERNVIAWNTLIACCGQHGYDDEALNFFDHMKFEGFAPVAATFPCILKASGSMGAFDKGMEVHAHIMKKGLMEFDGLLGNALVDMYAKCGMFAEAAHVFNELPVHDVITWTSLISGYALYGHGREALSCFEQMQHEGFRPNLVSYICIIKACGSAGAVEKGERIHAEIVREMMEKDILLGGVLIDMYVKFDALEKAEAVFNKLAVWDVYSSTALILGYTQHGKGEKALEFYEQMRQVGVLPNVITFTCAIKACGSVGAAEKGKEIHVEVVKEELLDANNALGIALVDMYAKCCMIDIAQDVFDKLPCHDVACWNALLGGYAQVGKYDCVIESLQKMKADGKEPDLVTITLVLCACSHAGLAEKGQMYYNCMSNYCDAIFMSELCTPMVDLSGRAGQFSKVLVVISKMSAFDPFPAWASFLGACQKWGNAKLGKLAFDHLIQWHTSFPAAYVCMSNIYVAAGMQEEAEKIELMRIKNGAFMDVSDNSYMFLVDGSER